MKNGMFVHENGTKAWWVNDLLHRVDGPAIEQENGDKYWFKNGEIHREDGPAVEHADGEKAWLINGKLHREDGPAEELADGTKKWYLNDKCHREDGPAIEEAYGNKLWCINGVIHREDGPAVEWANGCKEWWVNGLLHRVDGPAIELATGEKRWGIKSRDRKSWWLNGVEVTEQIVMQPETITLAQIQKSRNNEVRAIMIERYGWARYLADSKAKMLDKRNNAIENTKEALFSTRSFGNRLVVTCPTGRVFTLSVPSDITTCEAAQQWLGNSTKEINVIGRT